MQSHKNLHQIVRLILIAFLLTALSLTFWSVLRADNILSRDDNPRQVDAVLQIQRGQILDRNSRLLAETTGSETDTQRRYPFPDIGPAVGYYSFRHGTAGVEDSLNSVLRGDAESPWLIIWRNAIHAPQIGQDVQTTLDADLQTLAETLMADEKGALVLFSQTGQTADILSLVSHPSYDPNRLQEEFESLTEDEEAPLLNRITQGQYQPGLILQPFLLASLLDNGTIHLDETIEHPNRPILINETATYCMTTAPEMASWQDVLNHRCPGPLLDLAQDLSLTDLNNAFRQFYLTEQPQFLLDTETNTYPPLASTEQAIIGQDNLIVTPLQIAQAWLALNNNGRFPRLRLVSHIQDETGEWLPFSLDLPPSETAVSPQTAYDILQSLPTNNGIIEFSTLVLSGPEGTTNTWYLGSAPTGESIVIILEDQADLEKIEEIGIQIITAAQ